jgi:predicted nucleotidyltransferase
MTSIVKEKLPQLTELCRRYRVERMYLFGSAARDDFDPATSDIDFLIAFSPELDVMERGQNFLDLMLALDDLFGREVDLITEKQLTKPRLIENINRDKLLVYEAA